MELVRHRVYNIDIYCQNPGGEALKPVSRLTLTKEINCHHTTHISTEFYSLGFERLYANEYYDLYAVFTL